MAPTSDLHYVVAKAGDSWWGLWKSLGLKGTHTDLWSANGRSQIDPGTIVLIPPHLMTLPAPPADELEDQIAASVVVLREWATLARSIPVTSVNSVAVLTTLVTDIAGFCESFADMFDNQQP